MTKLAWTSPGKGSVVALAVVVLLAAAPSARASSCVRIDTTMDMLSTQDQKAALLVFEDALRAAYDDMYEDIKMIRDRRRAKRMSQGEKH